MTIPRKILAATAAVGLSLAACAGPSSGLATLPTEPRGYETAQTGLRAKHCATQPCIYVGNEADPGTGSITVYAEKADGDVAPLTTISGEKTGLNDPWDIALDADHNIYVANYSADYTGSVTVYAAGSHGNVAPIQSIEGQPSGDIMKKVSGVGVDANGKIYASAWLSNSVSVYAAGASGEPTPIQYIAGSYTQLSFPSYIAITQNGTIYVPNWLGNSVTVYARGASGNVAPARMISGSNTLLYHCNGIAVDGKGTIYVGNLTLGSSSGLPGVTVYKKGASGNVAPIRTISGSQTKLQVPNGLAVDSDGNLYVTDYASGSILVYAKGANGNVAPIRTISGSKSHLYHPAGITVY